ncbi:hypothetical protein GGI07_004724 [Coemansia sp. Benny D115]|nr:hypothetical protein GGI07_004724 [Coemansia sp. Benny D115]
MRKSSGLKTGLNLRKPAADTNRAPARSVFASDPTSPKPSPLTKPDASRISQKPAEPEQPVADPSVYAYDEFYDEISNARKQLKQSRKDDMRPKYMEKLLETAKQRHIQQEVVREKLLEKEREREADMYKDTEVFVTKAYKEKKEQRMRLAEEEKERERQEEDQAKTRLGTAGFYRGFLDQIDRDDVSRLVAENISKGASSADGAGTGAVQHKPEERVLSAGLNVSKNSARRDRTRFSKEESQSTASLAGGAGRLFGGPQHSSSSGHRYAGSDRVLWKEMEEQSKQRADEKEQEMQRLVKRYARRNDDAAVEAARQRFLQRKLAREQTPVGVH